MQHYGGMHNDRFAPYVLGFSPRVLDRIAPYLHPKSTKCLDFIFFSHDLMT